MKLLQTYETWICDLDQELAFGCFVVPQRTFAVRDTPSTTNDVITQLGFTRSRRIRVAQLAYAISALLVASKDGRDFSSVYDQILAATSDQQLKDIIDPHVVSFAEQVSFLDVIPFEVSPLAPAALASLLAKTGGVGVGAYVGFVVAGTTPFLLITVPGGMLLCGAAAGIATGMQEGLRELIRRWLSGKPPRDAQKKSRTEDNLGRAADQALDSILKPLSEEFVKVVEEERQKVRGRKHQHKDQDEPKQKKAGA